MDFATSIAFPGKPDTVVEIIPSLVASHWTAPVLEATFAAEVVILLYAVVAAVVAATQRSLSNGAKITVSMRAMTVPTAARVMPPRIRATET